MPAETGSAPHLILGFDTSGAYCAVALVRPRSDGHASLLADRHEDMARGQAESLLPMAEALLADAGATWRDLAAIGVGTGPGNFTGVRVAVSAARGLALGLGIPAVGVSSFAAFGHGHDGPVIVALPGARGAVHLCRLRAGTEEAMLTARRDELGAALADLAAGEAICVTGPEAATVASATNSPVLRVCHPIAEAVARIAAGRYTVPVARPAPVYLRPADAAPPSEAPPRLLPDAAIVS